MSAYNFLQYNLKQPQSISQVRLCAFKLICPLPATCLRGDGSLGTKVKITERETVLQQRINSPELNEVQLLLTENIIYVFLKIESKNYINSNEV